MNKDTIEGQGRERVGKLRAKWGKLTDDDLEVIKGNRDQLMGILQQRYGLAKDQAKKEVDDFYSKLH